MLQMKAKPKGEKSKSQFRFYFKWFYKQCLISHITQLNCYSIKHYTAKDRNSWSRILQTPNIKLDSSNIFGNSKPQVQYHKKCSLSYPHLLAAASSSRFLLFRRHQINQTSQKNKAKTFFHLQCNETNVCKLLKFTYFSVPQL